eukprot:2536513-Rhodomonas_salina.1
MLAAGCVSVFAHAGERGCEHNGRLYFVVDAIVSAPLFYLLATMREIGVQKTWNPCVVESYAVSSQRRKAWFDGDA